MLVIPNFCLISDKNDTPKGYGRLMRNDQIMVDWLSGVIESPVWLRAGYAPYDTGRTVEVTPNGELKTLFKNWLRFEGSYSNKVSLKSVSGSDLWISGNPSKFFQGHNAFGSGRVIDQFFELGLWIRQRGGKGFGFPSPNTFFSGEFNPPRFTRVDLTRSLRFSTQKEAADYLRDVVANSRSRHGSPIIKGGTGYFGKNSTRWTMKVYLKHEELTSTKNGHGLDLSRSDSKKIIDWSEGVVRHELTLRSPEIEKLKYPYDTSLSNLQIFESYYSKISWNGNAMKLSPEIENKLNTRQLMVFTSWLSGVDVRSKFSAPTFYRVRKEILTAVNVDISLPPVSELLPVLPVSITDSRWDPEPIKDFFFEPQNLEKIYLRN